MREMFSGLMITVGIAAAVGILSLSIDKTAVLTQRVHPTSVAGLYVSTSLP
jgi:hypothetical protein